MAEIRNVIADYLNIAENGSAEEYALMGVGITKLDESFGAQSDGKCYIHQKTKSNSIKSYEEEFAFESELISDEKVVMALYNVGRNNLTGKDAEKDYIRVETFRPISGSENTYAARKFRVAVEVSNCSGEGGDNLTVSGSLKAVGDFIDGKFDKTTKEFTALVES